MDNKQLAKLIFETVGQSQNITSATNCMTRLRLHLVNKDAAMIERLKRIDGVLGINDTEGELQIILGPGKATNVTNELQQILSRSSSKPQIGDGKALHEEIRAKNATPAKLFLKKIASIFMPLIPGFIACGLITGCVGLSLKMYPAIADYPVIKLLSVAGNTVFWGMNLFVGFNAAKVFGGTPILGGILAALISHPELANITLSESALVPGRGGVISVILVAALGAWIEKRLHKVIPEMFDLFLTPLVTFLISGAAAIFILQPVGGFISETIGNLATNAIQSGGAAVGLILAGFWLPLVMFGVHQAMTPIHVDLIAQYGVTILLPILAMAGAGQVGASIAVYFKTKNQFLKKTIASALPVGIMGVGEPLIYGVTFPLGKPFIAACIGGAAGGAVEASFMVGAATLGISGLPLAAATNNIPVYFIGLVTAYVVGFIATWIIGFDDPENND
ncbi:MAG: PTS transporter subunit EIIC [Selenomonadaceae bacterium]|nr:PTS transporter subunit EIIC [Selenomonadaceae bacterium]MBR1857965.1 PTS transporter subunit EIIC [Selenomonadaceae bacterium]